MPEARNEEFDFVPFVKEKDIAEYSGDWRLYFVRRNATSDLLGLADMETGTAHFEQGIVYELTDDRFIFDLLNFEKHDSFEMNNIFDIISPNFRLITGTGESGGYHAQMIMSRLFDQMFEQQDI